MRINNAGSVACGDTLAWIVHINLELHLISKVGAEVMEAGEVLRRLEAAAADTFENKGVHRVVRDLRLVEPEVEWVVLGVPVVDGHREDLLDHRVRRDRRE